MNSTEIRASFLQGRVTVAVGDITAQRVDAIVNAANSTLMGGGGVDGAIHRAGGPQILEECRTIRRTLFPSGLPTGEAVMTTGGSLKARFVIHTVGPVRGESGERDGELLAACYRNSLALAARHSLKTIAFPSISTGAYGYPREEAAAVASVTVTDFLLRDDTLTQVLLVFFSEDDARVFLKSQRFENRA